MDKPTEQELILNYDRGWRAYDIHDTTQKLFQNVDTGKTYWLLSDEDHTDWHALRAYQDEQRKKGEPIVFDANNEEVYEWFRKDYTAHGQRYLFYAIVEPNEPESIPRIQCYNSPYPRPDHRNCIARFTNFRWRPGHGPKADDQRKDYAARGREWGEIFREIDREPKGGSNG